MEITYFQDYDRLSDAGARLLLEQIREKPDLLICTATGNSPTGLYRRVVESLHGERSLTRLIRIIKLDEWAGIGHGVEGSCEHYLRHHLLDPLNIDQARFISFISDAPHPEDECGRIGSRLAGEGPIDVAILGLGKNGHLGFNEPGGELEPHCHLVDLTSESQAHSMMKHAREKPAQGMTLGMKDILSSKTIILVVSGEGKEESLATLLAGRITTSCPASFLWLHDHVHCLVMQPGEPA